MRTEAAQGVSRRGGLWRRRLDGDSIRDDGFAGVDVAGVAARFVIVLVLAGFPIALILAWAFDAGPDGVHVTREQKPDAECPPAAPGRDRNILTLVIIGLLISALIGYFVLNRTSSRKLEKSIAVLPFANFSNDRANEYFADGIQDDVLTNLAKISALKVISRTSVLSYRGQAHNIREIGKTLNVRFRIC